MTKPPAAAVEALEQIVNTLHLYRYKGGTAVTIDRVRAIAYAALSTLRAALAKDSVTLPVRWVDAGQTHQLQILINGGTFTAGKIVASINGDGCVWWTCPDGKIQGPVDFDAAKAALLAAVKGDEK